MLDLSVLAQRRDGPLGIAVSGGGDSVALLLLLREWAQSTDLTVATVDHGLRAESAEEAAWVATLCQNMNLPHRTLKWMRPPETTGNLAEQARDARRQLLADWIVAEGGNTVCLGHTQDDVAETFLMRLSRGSGLDGLSAMRAVSERDGVTWLRPMLNAGRQGLRDYLRSIGQAWVDDPTNEDDSYTRARTRKALRVLQDLDIDPVKIAQTAQRLESSRRVLSAETAQLAQRCIHQTQYGELILSRLAFEQAAHVLQERLLRTVIAYFGGQAHTPRQQAVQRLHDCVMSRGATTLAGVQMRGDGGKCHFFREPAAVSPAITPQPAAIMWDHRWIISPLRADWHVAALGAAGLLQCDARPKGLRAVVAETLPAVWNGGCLVATPVLKPHDDITFRQKRL